LKRLKSLQLTWEKLALERLKLLRQWKRYVVYIVEAVKKLNPNAHIYLIGSIAEGTYTALSDVDLLVVLPGKLDNHSLLETSIRIWEEAFKLGLPWNYPINLIVVDEERAQRFLKTARKTIQLL